MRGLLNFSLSAVSGLLLGMAFPDTSIGWLAFVAMAPLLYVLSREPNGWYAVAYGWISQTVAWLFMVPWVVRVMSHYGGLPLLTGIALFVLMAMVLGLYGALFGLLVHLLRPAERFGVWLLIPLAWAAVELARTYLLTGFPWNLIAASIVDYAPLIQIDRAIGPYGLGCLILLPSVVMAWIFARRPRGTASIVVIGGAAMVLGVWWATGYVAVQWRAAKLAPTSTAALLQPNISQEMRWDTDNLLAIFHRMMDMTSKAADRGVDLIVWPESTVPLSYASSDFYHRAIESLSGQRHLDVILGSVAEDAANENRLWNAAFLVSDGKTIGHYDKIRLVPFGEYVPLRKMLFFAQKLVHAVGDFQFGTSDSPLVGKIAYGPAICYEIVFPAIARNQVRHGATVLVTITNDAWYDGTSAPRQHLNQARLRAVETDRYLLRAATTGISAVVDPFGRVVQELPMGQEGTIYARFSPRSDLTPYVRFGDWFAWLAAAIVIIAVLWRRRTPVSTL